MSDSPIEVVGNWLQNLLDPDAINNVVAPDAIYVSLNTEDSELSKIMPWAGTSRGPQAFLTNLGKVVSSPFSILSKVIDGKVTYLQYLEDSYATAASFRKDGSWIVQTEPGAEPFQV